MHVVNIFGTTKRIVGLFLVWVKVMIYTFLLAGDYPNAVCSFGHHSPWVSGVLVTNNGLALLPDGML